MAIHVFYFVKTAASRQTIYLKKQKDETISPQIPCKE